MSKTRAVFVVNVLTRDPKEFHVIGVFSSEELAKASLEMYLDARWGKGNWIIAISGQYVRSENDRVVAGYISECDLDVMIDDALMSARVKRDIDLNWMPPAELSDVDRGDS